MMMQNQILIVDDHPPICKSLSDVINRAGYEAHVANDGYEALEAIRQKRFSVVVTDIRMPKMDGIEVLQKAKSIIPDVEVIVITGNANVDSAVEAMKNGAYDYIRKPFSMDKITAVIEEAISRHTGEAMVPVNTSDNSVRQIITADPQMLEALNKARLVAQTDATVLIEGESGTGKELIARAIHAYSARSSGRYIPVNCAAMPEGLIESELFGHEKGAFTGAFARRIGKLEQAHGGTLLLDEVSEMAKPCQAKLLRALQEREIVRVGGTQIIEVDVRVIATTNKNLANEVDMGNFREDLFYRLCVVPIILPPLRERKDDIPILAQHFNQQFCARMGKKLKNISSKAMESLISHSWHGNVRELENTIERAIALSENGSISPASLFFSARSKPSRYISLKIGSTSVSDAERELIIGTLESVGGNKQKAAKILGITSKTIRSKLYQYGYTPPQSRDTGEQ
jgi:DNA-binding NtrC family response regulator